jgi:hypothetical protein
MTPRRTVVETLSLCALIASVGCASLAAFDQAIATGAAAVVSAEGLACEAATDLDPSGASAICIDIDAAGNAIGTVFATLPTDAAIVTALLTKTAAPTATVAQILAQGHIQIMLPANVAARAARRQVRPAK